MGETKRITLLLLFVSFTMLSQKTIYLFPGQGSDERLFSKLKFDSTYQLVNIKYPVPEKGTTLKQFAAIVSRQIDTTKGDYIFIGVSLGGMICSELNDIFRPEKTIVISSAKCRSELPARYKFQKYIPLYKIIPAFIIKGGALFLQPIVEPDRKKEKATFKSMLKSKDAKYLKRTISMIVKWDKKNYNESIVHIHGTSDHTLPLRKVKADTTIKKGSHMMTLTKGEEINLILQGKLNP